MSFIMSNGEAKTCTVRFWIEFCDMNVDYVQVIRGQDM